MEADGERMKSFALQTLKGAAAEFCSRTLKLNQNIEWRRLRQLLIEQYSDTSDAYVAKSRLRELSQQPSESIQNFAERIFALADEAYHDQNIDDPLIQGILVDILIEGVLNDAD